MDFEETYKPRLDPVWSKSVFWPEMGRLPEEPKKKSRKINKVNSFTGKRVDSIGRPVTLPALSATAKEIHELLKTKQLKLHELLLEFPDKHKSRITSALRALLLREMITKSGTPRCGTSTASGLIYSSVINPETLTP